jgi:hypothetical protein
MYFPYLRGRGEELNALIATASRLGKNGRIIPVIEPVRDGERAMSTLKKCATACRAARLTLGFIVNPSVGDLSRSPASVTPYLGLLQTYSNVIPFFIVQAATLASEVNAFLATNQNGLIGFVHYCEPTNDRRRIVNSLLSVSARSTHLFIDGRCSAAYIAGIGPATKILVRDGFIRRNRNADYPDRTPEYFSDLYATYRSLGYNGFSDFLTIGIDYVDTGSAPRAVALHLTHNSRQTIQCTHFVSTSNASIANRDGKYREALNSLYTFSQTSPATFRNSTAVGEFLQDRANGTSTSLGMMKRRSMCHHLEMMCGIV